MTYWLPTSMHEGSGKKPGRMGLQYAAIVSAYFDEMCERKLMGRSVSIYALKLSNTGDVSRLFGHMCIRRYSTIH
jgi:hypothetical protein